MTSSSFTNSIKPEETQSGQPKSDEALLPPPINWATRPVPRSLPTTPRKPHHTIATLNLNLETDTRSLPTTPQKPQGTIATLATLNFNLETNMNDAFGPSYPQPESAGGSGLKTPLSHPKYHFITAPILSPRGRQKYYVVFVGKCVGIFAFWPYVKSLTKDLKDATFQGFETFELAAENYNKARSIGIVSVRRFPGDELQYGPESEGMQDLVEVA